MQEKSECRYQLDFELSEQQQLASSKIKDAILKQDHLLLHAVTGAGKTEMIFEGISQGRKNGMNVAVVSP
ncbi:DEAD/DEAH box helicase family protein [Mammaliicoccus sciuri]|uniref:DEAD/DEAH box helicase family protein n=1 Tax=Mammaliicoccus sciuri TaxID=1296 RepID=UPI003F5684B8